MSDHYTFNEIMERRSAATHRANNAAKSYYRVRQALGYLGLALPFILIFSGLFGAQHLEPSISDFFHTFSRDIFVGTMFAIGVFLVSYDGYVREPGESFSDNWITTIAGISAFGVALFPNESPNGQVETLSQYAVGIERSPLVHYACALTFFACLAQINLSKFAKTKDLARRRIYVGCGRLIWVAALFIGVFSVLKLKGGPVAQAVVLDYNLVFWAEAIGIWAFALSWLAKGRADKSLLGILGKKRKSG